MACVACRLVERAGTKVDRPAGRQADKKTRLILLPVSFVFYFIVSLQCGGAIIKRGQTDFEGENRRTFRGGNRITFKGGNQRNLMGGNRKSHGREPEKSKEREPKCLQRLILYRRPSQESGPLLWATYVLNTQI